MRGLCSGAGGARLPAVLPVMPALWCAADSQLGQAEQAPRGNHGQAAGGAGGLDELRARRSAASQPGKERAVLCADWPGRTVGIRAPEANETPLSAAEVLVALSMGLACGNADEVDAWPMVRRVRPAGTWPSVAMSRKRGPFDGLLEVAA